MSIQAIICLKPSSRPPPPLRKLWNVIVCSHDYNKNVIWQNFALRSVDIQKKRLSNYSLAKFESSPTSIVKNIPGQHCLTAYNFEYCVYRTPISTKK